MRSPRKTASSTECVTKNTVASCSRHKLDQQVLHVEPGGGIERAERLVHQNDVRRQDQRARDGDALAHASGKLMRIFSPVLNGVQADFADPQREPGPRAPCGPRPNIPGRTRCCRAPCGCQTKCSPETPCRGRGQGLPPACPSPSLCPWWPETAGADPRSAAEWWTCRSRKDPAAKQTRHAPAC